MKIVVLYSKDSSCGYHRLILPYNNLPIGKNDNIIFFDISQELPASLLEGADFVVFSRVLPYDRGTIEIWRRYFEFKIIVDIDDFWELNVNHSLYKDHKKFKEEIQQSIEIADLVTTTNSMLRDKILFFHPRVEIFPNAFPFGKDQFVDKPEREEDGFNIMYTGGQTHYYDLKTISPTIQKLYNPDTNFIIAGFEELDDFWIKIYNMVGKKVYFKKGLPLNSYMNHYDIADIAVAPLDNNPFNNYKSNLKVIEAGCKNIPIVCSSVPPYLHDMSEGLFICKNNKEWFNTISLLRKDKLFRKEAGDALGEYVRKNYNLFEINKDRYELLSSLN